MGAFVCSPTFWSAGEPVIYVPWSAFTSQVLEQLNEEDRSVAVVVNEFGELAGAASIDDILRFVLSPRSDEELAGPWWIKEVGPDHYRVSGSVSIRSLGKQLGIATKDEGITTVAGFIQRHCGRFPRVGDSADLGQFLLTVSQELEEGLEIDVTKASIEEGGTT